MTSPFLPMDQHLNQLNKSFTVIFPPGTLLNPFLPQKTLQGSSLLIQLHTPILSFGDSNVPPVYYKVPHFMGKNMVGSHWNFLNIRRYRYLKPQT